MIDQIPEITYNEIRLCQRNGVKPLDKCKVKLPRKRSKSQATFVATWLDQIFTGQVTKNFPEQLST